MERNVPRDLHVSDLPVLHGLGSEYVDITRPCPGDQCSAHGTVISIIGELSLLCSESVLSRFSRAARERYGKQECRIVVLHSCM